MTETVMDPPPSPPPPPDPRRLVRDPDDRVVAGVCAAFGRYTGTDPVLWRVTVAVLALFGGAGLALYAFGWVLLPKVGERESFAERVVRRPDRTVTVLGAVLLVVGAVILLALLDNGPGVGAVAVLGGIAYLVARERRHSPPFDPAPSQVLPEDLPPRPPRERSRLGGITLSAALLVAGLLTALHLAGVDEVTVPRVLAAVLLVLGVGVVVGTWWGRARWLIPIGLLVALLLAATAAVDRFDGSAGERTWRAVDGGDYSLGAGEAVLDLRSLRGVDDAQLRARVGFGSLMVLVPRSMSVEVDSDIRLGELDAPGIGRNDGDHLRERFVVGDADEVTVRLDLEVGLGEIEVSYVNG